MSNVNIKRAVENIRSGTTIYSPIVEVIANAIEAIEDKNEKNGAITIVTERSKQQTLDGSIQDVESFEITDNGIGFTDANRDAFDTLWSDRKKGGKGFGRFVCLKYFEDLSVESVYKDGDTFKKRSFFMGKKNDIIVKEKTGLSESTKSGTTIRLISVKDGKVLEKKLQTIAKILVEKLLPYFLNKEYVCPRIIITEKDKSNSIVLNNFVNNELSGVIKDIDGSESTFTLKGVTSNYEFNVRVLKFYSPKHHKSKISLVAHNREVTETAIHNYIPEFVDEFFEKIPDGSSIKEKNYIIKAYVFGDYLDKHVSFERGGFVFKKANDVLRRISKYDIEKEASIIAKNAVGDKITKRQEKKRAHINSYVETQAPWHREILKNIDLSGISFNPSDEEMELSLQKEKFNQELSITRDVKKLLEESSIDNYKDDVAKVVRKISGSSKNELVHYIALRRHILEIFRKSLEYGPDKKYSSEGFVHDIIFPRKGNSERTSLKDHNLWIVDERLNFTDYVSSDLPLNGGKSERPDLLVYGKRVLFRSDNVASNPVTIFEFKKPQRDDFVNHSSKEDPVVQIVRYVNSIREGNYKTPEGRDMQIAENTPFYGYIVCDLTKKVRKWLDTEKEFKPLPDNLGWFRFRENINLYIEVLSWDKVLKDATMRNKIFFHKLGI
ncbi:MAG: sensor histidine kinase [bacterium]|nr:sensor histidine kinase [bacterium]